MKIGGRVIEFVKVCPYGFYECKLPIDWDCPTRKLEDYFKRPRLVGKCEYVGQELSERGWKGRFKYYEGGK